MLSFFDVDKTSAFLFFFFFFFFEYFFSSSFVVKIFLHVPLFQAVLSVNNFFSFHLHISEAMLSSIETSANPVYCPASSYETSSLNKLGFRFDIPPLYSSSLILPPPSYAIATSPANGFVNSPPYVIVCREKTSDMDVENNALVANNGYETRISDDDDENAKDLVITCILIVYVSYFEDCCLKIEGSTGYVKWRGRIYCQLMPVFL